MSLLLNVIDIGEDTATIVLRTFLSHAWSGFRFVFGGLINLTCFSRCLELFYLPTPNKTPVVIETNIYLMSFVRSVANRPFDDGYLVLNIFFCFRPSIRSWSSLERHGTRIRRLLLPFQANNLVESLPAYFHGSLILIYNKCSTNQESNLYIIADIMHEQFNILLSFLCPEASL